MYGRLKRQVSSAIQAKSNQVHPDKIEQTPYLANDQVIRLLTFNIQVGISTSRYRHYLTKSWQHVLPNKDRKANLDRIADKLRAYDIVALQEVDGGSLRSGFVNQVEYLANAADFEFWYQQLNRNFGPFAKHSNGLVSRFKPFSIDEIELPGRVPGRGAIVTQFGRPEDPIVLVVMHLALTVETQIKQLNYLWECVGHHKHLVLMGDLNTHSDTVRYDSLFERSDLVTLPGVKNTFPSWQPTKALDHILVSRSLIVKRAGVVPFTVSDHLPIELDFMLPEGYWAA